ncbi:hypothetical protein ABTD84_20370, partial [Acinetobacter baumannii]
DVHELFDQLLAAILVVVATATTIVAAAATTALATLAPAAVATATIATTTAFALLTAGGFDCGDAAFHVGFVSHLELQAAFAGSIG